MCAVVFETTAVLDYFLEGDTSPACSSDGTFAPGGINELVAVAGVLVDLLDTACSRALEADDCGLSREDGLILKFGESDLLGVVDKALNLKKVFAGVYFRDSAVVADEEVGIPSDFGLSRLARL